MNEAATLRLAAADDFDAIAAITSHYIRHTSVHFGEADVTGGELRTLWHDHRDRYPWLVTEQRGAVVGYAKAGEFRSRAAYRWSCETGIYLSPSHGGRGLGAPLYRRLLDVLRAQGFTLAIGGITLPNPASVRLHERLGFTHWGTIARVGRKFGRWHDVGFWQLALQDAAYEPGPIGTPGEAFART